MRPGILSKTQTMGLPMIAPFRITRSVGSNPFKSKIIMHEVLGEVSNFQIHQMDQDRESQSEHITTG